METVSQFTEKPPELQLGEEKNRRKEVAECVLGDFGCFMVPCRDGTCRRYPTNVCNGSKPAVGAVGRGEGQKFPDSALTGEAVQPGSAKLTSLKHKNPSTLAGVVIVENRPLSIGKRSSAENYSIQSAPDRLK